MTRKADHLLAGIENPSSIVNAGDEFIILDDPTLLPYNLYPYRNDGVIATFCEKGYACGKVNVFDKPNEQSDACISSVMARKRRMKSNLREYRVEANGLILILPRQIISSSEVSPDFKGKVMLISERFADSIPLGAMLSLTRSVEHKPYYVFSSEATDAFKSYIGLCKNMMQMSGNFDVMEVLQLISKAFFIAMKEYLAQQVSPGKPASSSQEEIVESFLNLVEMGYRHHRNLDYYADKMCKSTKYLSRVVAESTGRKASEWIERCVIMDAKAQLVSSRKRIAEISDDLGFPSQSFFGKYFKRVTGLSPRAYREANE